MNKFFPEIKKNFGFGCMRFPVEGEQVKVPEVMEMVDAFLAAGFNYFDTALPYHSGASEQVIRQCLTSRYPRDSYVLTDKLNPRFFSTEAEVRPMVEKQLQACGVDYFDFYLFHGNCVQRNKVFTETRSYEIIQELKAEGKIRHVGMSFHDSAQILDEILTAHPEIEVVQLQFNYVDYEDPTVQSKACYDVCCKHGKPVMVMEPVKGGSLVNLPDQAARLMTGGSPASYAIRFAASFDNIAMVLSGMSSLQQMQDNISFMQNFKPLTPEELSVVERVRTIYQAQHRIPCTACRYCTDGCPAGIEIPALFACLNDKRENKEGADARYAAMAAHGDSCVSCGQCEDICPQHLKIRELLQEVDAAFRA